MTETYYSLEGLGFNKICVFHAAHTSCESWLMKLMMLFCFPLADTVFFLDGLRVTFMSAPRFPYRFEALICWSRILPVEGCPPMQDI